MTPNNSLQTEFTRFCGIMAESLSFNRSIGQIYGLLYINSEPLSLGEIAKRLSMSKGNASINVRTLEGWGAIRSVGVSGSRRDHYEANRNLKEIALKRVQEGLSKRFDMAESMLEGFHNRMEREAVDIGAKQYVADLKRQVGKVRKMTQMLSKGLDFLS